MVILVVIPSCSDGIKTHDRLDLNPCPFLLAFIFLPYLIALTK